MSPAELLLAPYRPLIDIWHPETVKNLTADIDAAIIAGQKGLTEAATSAHTEIDRLAAKWSENVEDQSKVVALGNVAVALRSAVQSSNIRGRR